MKAETTMEAAMKKAGGPSARDARFTVAIAEFHNNGGSYEGAVALLRAAYKLPGEGQLQGALPGHILDADARQPNGSGAGQSPFAQQGQATDVRPSPTPSSGEGQRPVADKASLTVPSTAAPHREMGGQIAIVDKAKVPVPPAREPSRSDVKAAAMVAKASAKAVLDIGWLGHDAIPGGPKYTDLRWRDIAGMAERQLKEGATHAKAALALRMIEREGEKLGQVDPERKWVDDLPADRVMAIARATEDDALKPSLVAWLRGGNELTQNMITGERHAQ